MSFGAVVTNGTILYDDKQRYTLIVQAEDSVSLRVLRLCHAKCAYFQIIYNIISSVLFFMKSIKLIIIIS